jgi:two-component system cell cycle response regulator
LALFDLDGFKRYNDAYGHPAGDALLQRLSAELSGVVAGHGRAYRLGGDEFCLLLEADGSDAVLRAATVALGARGDGFDVTASYGRVALPADAGDSEEALHLADRRMYAAKESRRPSSAGLQTRSVLLKVLSEREPDLHEHSSNVMSLARGVARRLGLGAEEREIVARAAELHDIGKMAIPDAILNKPGPLDDQEWRFMRRHTIIGEDILNVAPALHPVASLVRASHERWDGRGYPDGTSGEAIPEGARIVAVCDAFSAMIQDRPYQSGLTVGEAVAEIERSAGQHFDPRVVEAFAAEIRSEAVPV